MRTNTTGVGVAVLGVMVVGWLLGLAAHRSTIEATTYADISPQLLLLAMALCALGGAAIRLLAPRRQRIRTGAFAGVATAVTILAGYLGLVAFYWDRYFAAHQGESGETWCSFLLESWFWIGIPLVGSAALGAAGWLVADRLAGRGASGQTGGQALTGRPTA